MIKKKNRIFVPSTVRKELIEFVHKDLLHPGIWKTYQHMSRDFYFPNMHLTIKKQINRCYTCARTKTQPAKLPQRIPHTEIAARPFQKFFMDVMYLPSDISAICPYVLIVVDRFSSYCWTELLEDQTVESVKKALLKILSSIPQPDEFIADSAQNLNAQEIVEFLKNKGIIFSAIPPYSQHRNY